MSLARDIVAAIRADPEALAQLRDALDVDGGLPVGDRSASPAFTVRTLAAELGRSERSIRGAIARGELAAVKRGRGWIIGADAVAAWATAAANAPSTRSVARARRNVMRDALKR